MSEERDLVRHLEEGGNELWNRPEPPPLDLAAIVGGAGASFGAGATERAPARGAAAHEPAAREDAGPGYADENAPLAAPPRGIAAPRRSPSRWWPALRLGSPLGAVGGAFACVAIGVALGAAIFKSDVTNPAVAPSPTLTATATTSPAPERRIVLTRLAAAPASAGGEASVIASAAGGKTVWVRLHGMPHVPHGSFLEVWALGRGGKMVSLGALRVDAHGAATADLRLPVSLNRFPTLDVSLERADGNPAHSTDSMLRGAA